MHKIDFNFFCQLLKENLSYTEISEILKKNYPNVRGFSVPSIKNFCKENGLSSRISQNDVNEMVRVAVEEVQTFIIVVLLYYYRAVAKLGILGSNCLNFQ